MNAVPSKDTAHELIFLVGHPDGFHQGFADRQGALGRWGLWLPAKTWPSHLTGNFSLVDLDLGIGSPWHEGGQEMFHCPHTGRAHREFCGEGGAVTDSMVAGMAGRWGVLLARYPACPGRGGLNDYFCLRAGVQSNTGNFDSGCDLGQHGKGG